MKTGILIACVVLLVGICSNAQDPDPYFAQRSQAFIDPSRTGADHGLAAAMVARSQWVQASAPFRTSAMVLSYGTESSKHRRGRWGVGSRLVSDKSGDPTLRMFQAGVQFAHHLRVAKQGALSIGFGTVYEQRTLGGAEGRWASQYNGDAFDPSLPSGEILGMQPTSAMNLDAGLSYALMAPGVRFGADAYPRFVVGVSAARVAVQQLSGEPMPGTMPGVRYTAHAALILPAQTALFDRLFIETLAHNMGPHNTARVHVAVGRVPFKAERLSDSGRNIGYRIGVGYRYADAIMGTASVDWRRFSIGMLHGWAVPTEDRMVRGNRSSELFLELRLSKQAHRTGRR